MNTLDYFGGPDLTKDRKLQSSSGLIHDLKAINTKKHLKRGVSPMAIQPGVKIFCHGLFIWLI